LIEGNLAMRTTYAIKNEVDDKAAIEQLDNLWDSKAGSPEADQLEVLGILIDQYEAQQFPISAPEAI